MLISLLLALKAITKLKGSIASSTLSNTFALLIMSYAPTEVALLESRLDTVIYRAKFAPTVFSARQIINHGHVKVNKKKVNISSYTVKETDLIEIREKSKKLTVIDGSIQSKERDIPEYIKMDDKNKTVKLVRVPKFSEVPFPVIMEPNLVIEYYSR